MKLILILSTVAVLSAAQDGVTYSTENDDFNVEALASDIASLKSFNGCFLETMTCDPVAADFRKDIPEAVAQSCAKCTQAQKHIFRRFLEALKEKLPQGYEDFKKKYDPDGKHFSALEEAVAAF